MRLKNSAGAHKEGLAMVVGVGDIPTWNCMLQSYKQVETESEPPWKYSPGHKSKKNAIQARSEIACFLRDPPCLVAPRQ